ncbi:hypothetical protein SLEP1_g25804 [Rubroshorea leprosula]|uniref:F-box associated beta-propeller type 3 domain-containing protein n=1 Tax=Rubroshorea leprosula TaxID=152421 RepID=A0AAV5JUQ0_9ROSI|nr:hypothetical protein SLEP1_g25804 [Rubroshorea leprosula]
MFFRLFTCGSSSFMSSTPETESFKAMDLSPKKGIQKKKATPPAEDLLVKGMDLLPSEVTIDILSRLPITSLTLFKLTSSSGGALVADQRLPALFLNRIIDSDPCLIMINPDSSASRQLYFVDSDGRGGYINTARKINPLKTVCGFDLVGCCHGLLCISIPKYYHSTQVHVLQICNPFVTVSNSIELPVPNRFVNQREIFGFGFHPRSREFKVIRIVFYELIMTGRRETVTVHKSEVQVLTVGTTEWRKKGASPYNFELKPPEALVEGSLHWAVPNFNNHHRVISFELAEEVFKEIPLPDFIEDYYSGYHLSELNGCLTVAGFSQGGRLDIWVMKEYNVKESWKKEYCINHYVDGQNGMVNGDFASNWMGRFVRVLCVLKNGEIVLECNKRALVSYDPKTDRFKALKINRLPQQFQAFAFHPTLFSVKETVKMKV